MMLRSEPVSLVLSDRGFYHKENNKLEISLATRNLKFFFFEEHGTVCPLQNLGSSTLRGFQTQIKEERKIRRFFDFAGTNDQ